MRKIALMIEELKLVKVKNLDVISQKLVEAKPNTLIPFKLPKGKTMSQFRCLVWSKCEKLLSEDFNVSSKAVGDILYILKEPKRSNQPNL